MKCVLACRYLIQAFFVFTLQIRCNLWNANFDGILYKHTHDFFLFHTLFLFTFISSDSREKCIVWSRKVCGLSIQSVYYHHAIFIHKSCKIETCIQKLLPVLSNVVWNIQDKLTRIQKKNPPVTLTILCWSFHLEVTHLSIEWCWCWLLLFFSRPKVSFLSWHLFIDSDILNLVWCIVHITWRNSKTDRKLTMMFPFGNEGMILHALPHVKIIRILPNQFNIWNKMLEKFIAWTIHKSSANICTITSHHIHVINVCVCQLSRYAAKQGKY